MEETQELRVLNVGSGAPSVSRLHPVFRNASWREIRVDIDPRVTPDIVADVTDLRESVETGTIDAVWSSHNIEHLHAHQVAAAIHELRRVLRPTGFALITCPDMKAVAQLVVEGKFEDTAYVSPSGAITPLDMMFGHSRAIADGNTFMAHHTGFTNKRLGRVLLEGGFPEAWVFSGSAFDLWAVALMRDTDKIELRRNLELAGLEFPK